MDEDKLEQTLGDPEVEVEEFDADEDFDTVVEDYIAPKSKDRPVYIDDLDDVVVDGVWTAREGQQIVVERWNCLDMNHPRWMGTSIYTVKMVDVLTGDVKLHDDEVKQTVMTHTVKGPRAGWRFKFATPGLNLHKRARPAEVEKIVAKTTGNDLKAAGEPRKKGQRRPKAVIEAEKKANAERRLKKAQRREENRVRRGMA